MARASLICCLCLGFVAGCTSYVRTTDPGAQIYLDDRLIGTGNAEFSRMGLPADAQLRAEASDGRVVEITLERSFTWTTALVALPTAYTGLLWAWQYPKRVMLQLPPSQDHHGGWDWEENRPAAPSNGPSAPADRSNPWLNPS